MEEEKKKYWLKIEKNFLNSSHIKVIKNMPNGKDYIIFYLAIMLESANTEGHLRFSELVPYNEEMLASITDTNIDIVRTAMKIFNNLGLISILQDGTIFLPDVPNRIGKECESAERVRIYREKLKTLQCNTEVTKSNDNKDKDINKDIYIYNKENNKEKKQDDYATTIINFLNLKSNDFKTSWEEFLKIRKSKKGKDTDYSLFLITKDLEKFSKIESEQIEILNNSIKNKWTGIFPLNPNNKNKSLIDTEIYGGTR